MKINRNEPCPCGSGLKYKKCCLGSQEISLLEKAQSDLESLERQVKDRLGDKCIITKNESIKMSEVILEFADDILDRAKNKKERESAIAMACMAWNIALVGETAAGQEAKNSIYEKIVGKNRNDAQLKEDLEHIFDMLIRRKLTEYPHINRYIMDYQYTETATGDANLNIASMIPKEELQTDNV